MSIKIISGQLKGSVLVVPEPARPTLLRSRQSLFDILVSTGDSSSDPQHFFENKIILDCFAGSGALGIEALSRGAQFAYFVDISQKSIDAIYKNIQKLKLENQSKIIKTDIFKIKRNAQPSDVIFVDPPYGKVSIAKTIKCLNEKGWIKEDTLIVIEEDISNFEDLSSLVNISVERKLGHSLFRIAKLKQSCIKC